MQVQANRVSYFCLCHSVNSNIRVSKRNVLFTRSIYLLFRYVDAFVSPRSLECERLTFGARLRLYNPKRKPYDRGVHPGRALSRQDFTGCKGQEDKDYKTIGCVL